MQTLALAISPHDIDTLPVSTYDEDRSVTCLMLCDLWYFQDGSLAKDLYVDALIF
jgi:hypothetical protein